MKCSVKIFVVSCSPVAIEKSFFSYFLYRVVKSSRLLSIGWLLSLAFLYKWRFFFFFIPGLAAYFDNSAIYSKPFWQPCYTSKFLSLLIERDTCNINNPILRKCSLEGSSRLLLFALIILQIQVKLILILSTSQVYSRHYVSLVNSDYWFSSFPPICVVVIAIKVDELLVCSRCCAVLHN